MKVLKPIIISFLFVFLWMLLSLVVSPVFIPNPADVLESAGTLICNGQLLHALLYSFTRITISCVLSGLTSMLLSILMCNSNACRTTIYPIVKTMRYIPVTAFYPILILWLGIGESMKIAFLFIAMFVSMLPSVVLCFDEVSTELVETGQTLGMKRRQITKMILLPAAMPSIAKQFLVMYGIGWTYIVIAETVNAKYGIGFTINIASARGHMDVVFVCVISIIIFSILFDKLGDFIISKVFKWKIIQKGSTS